MKQRYKQLVAEGMTVVPVWDCIGKLMLGSGYKRGHPEFLNQIEEFPEATHDEFLECRRMFCESMLRATDSIMRRNDP